MFCSGLAWTVEAGGKAVACGVYRRLVELEVMRMAMAVVEVIQRCAIGRCMSCILVCLSST